MKPGVGGDISSSRLGLISDETQPSQESPIVIVNYSTPTFIDWQYQALGNPFILTARLCST